MKDYRNSKIYKLTDNSTGECYIGSTTGEINIRLNGHRSNKNTGKYVASHAIIERGDYLISIIENYPCENNQELRMREQYWIDNTTCTNERRAFMTKENRNEANRAYDKKRTRDQKPYLKARYYYRQTWGPSAGLGNLLDIDPFLFE